jgi:hypothetical protein
MTHAEQYPHVEGSSFAAAQTSLSRAEKLNLDLSIFDCIIGSESWTTLHSHTVAYCNTSNLQSNLRWAKKYKNNPNLSSSWNSACLKIRHNTKNQKNYEIIRA